MACRSVEGIMSEFQKAVSQLGLIQAAVSHLSHVGERPGQTDLKNGMADAMLVGGLCPDSETVRARGC